VDAIGIDEDIAQLARFRFLRGLWPQLIDGPRDTIDTWIANVRRSRSRDPKGRAPFADGQAAMATLLDLGATPEQLGAFARMVAADAVFGVLFRLDDPHDDDISAELASRLPHWQLMEVSGARCVPTGRDLGGLYDDLVSMDPSDRKGRPPAEPTSSGEHDAVGGDAAL
jgi:hypothetical protein